ncbi:unnamed protein product [Parnassius mnemosyne]|uniref:Gamma-interferon-inducible lysosomal thiol reductase n=1 Tax=Parnassius mnemosyne TaxID=213953 RepID=A0AAV1KJ83_9NEOP
MVRLNIYIFFFLVYPFILLTNGYVPEKLHLTVYYESKCPDSKKFILEQLQPTVELLHKYVRLRLIPFGKSMSIDYGDEGFQCQHGPTECMGNLVQDCALKYMRKHNDVQRVNYVVCEMELEAGAMGNLGCVKHARLPTDDVERCVSTGEGIALQLDSEYHTNSLKPQFIPSITINGVFDQQIQESALVNLKETLCSYLKEAQPCAHYYNNKVWEYLFYSP